MKNKERICLFVIVAIMIGSISWIWKSKQPIQLRIGVMAGSYWDVPESDSYSMLENVIREFEAEHPNVEVVYQSGIRPEEYEEYIAKQILMDQIPDVMFITSDMFSTLSKNHTLQKLNRFIEQDQLNTDAYYAASFDEGKNQQNVYALPYESVPRLMFVNKSLLEKENIDMPSNDWTWKDFYEICKKVTKDSNHDGQIDQFGYYGYTWEDAVYSNGAHIYEEKENQVSLGKEAVIEASAFMRELVLLHDKKVTSEMFDKGMVVFCPMNYSNYRTYMPYPWRVKKYSTFEWDCITMPKGPSGGNTSQIDTLMIAMSSRSKHQDLAWEFMKKLSYDQTYQSELVKSSQGVSVLKEVMQSSDVMDVLKLDNPGKSTFEMHVLHEIMENGVAIRNTERYKQIMQAAQSRLDALMQNDEDLENALIRLERQLNSMLQK